MTVISVERDADALTLTFVAEFAAPVERVWRVWEDPRQLERWWGPPTWPATFERFDLEPSGGASYFMTGPDGEKARGWSGQGSFQRRAARWWKLRPRSGLPLPLLSRRPRRHHRLRPTSQARTAARSADGRTRQCATTAT